MLAHSRLQLADKAMNLLSVLGILLEQRLPQRPTSAAKRNLIRAHGTSLPLIVAHKWPVNKAALGPTVLFSSSSP